MPIEIRNSTEADKIDAEGFAALANGHCPDCAGFIFRPGPRAGVAQNIECVGCKSRFNVARWYTSPDGILCGDPPTLITADRISNTDEWREDLFPKVLE